MSATPAPQRRRTKESIKSIMRHLEGIKVSTDGGRAKFRLLARTPDGSQRTTEIQPDSATAQAINRQLVLEIATARRTAKAWRAMTRQLAREIASARRRAEAWRALLEPAQRSQADAIIQELSDAESMVRGSATDANLISVSP